MVKLLWEKEKVDSVLCLSQSGLSAVASKSEDEIFAREVPGSDIIISGHTHTLLKKPRVVNGCIIVQAWEYGKRMGVLDCVYGKRQVALKDYRSVTVDDSIPGDPALQAAVESFIGQIDAPVLKEYVLTYRQILAETAWDMEAVESETGMGNLAADSIRWYVNKYVHDPQDPTTRVVLAAVGVDADKDKPGVRELKEWVGLMEFVRSFPGTDSNGLPEIPASDRARQGRMAAKVSYSPVYLLSRGTFVTWGAFNALLLRITLLALLVVVILVKLQPRRRPAKT